MPSMNTAESPRPETTNPLIIRWQEGPILEVGANGVQVEEVLTACVRRLEYLRTLKADRYTSLAITKVEEAIMWLDARTADRVRRGVEGTSAD